MKDELNKYKRARLVEVASELFYERGFVGTTLDAIADQLEVNKPFIYQFFASKHEILAAVVEQEIRRTIDLLDLTYQRETKAPARLRSFVSAWVRENIEFRMIAMIFWQEQHHFSPDTQEENRNLQKVFNVRLTDLIESGIKSGEFNVDNPRLAAFALIGLAQWIPRWYRPDGEFEVDEIAAYFSEQALRIVGYQAVATLSTANARS
ncbi:MAG: TetR/AcrR family transcriptional regulator [Proteobacteria bacterium]|nr:TetR/AcrR family transcriptional regulator [Pseudomonadota bacterium]